jgi:hydroxymethylglutaryl-CoA lyase
MAATPEVIAALPPEPEGVAYRLCYLNAKGLERAKTFTNKVSLEGRLMIAASEGFSKRNANRTIDESIADIPRWIELYNASGTKVTTLQLMAAFGCNFDGEAPLGRAMDIVARVKAILEDGGGALERLSLCDTMGWGSPKTIQGLVGQVQDRYPDTKINLHLHDTRGLAMASAHAALQMGVADFDGSVGGLGGCPFAGHSGAAGNICTEDFVLLCHESGIETGINLDALIGVARQAEAMLGRPLPGKAMKSGSLESKRRAL